MPCYEINTISVDFKADNIEHLEEALKNLNLKYTKRGNKITIGGELEIDLDSSKVSCPANLRDLVNMIKREYSKTVIESIAQKKKWALKQTGNDSFVMRRY